MLFKNRKTGVVTAVSNKTTAELMMHSMIYESYEGEKPSSVSPKKPTRRAPVKAK